MDVFSKTNLPLSFTPAEWRRRQALWKTLDMLNQVSEFIASVTKDDGQTP
jgi:hypothetical protein